MKNLFFGSLFDVVFMIKVECNDVYEFKGFNEKKNLICVV